MLENLFIYGAVPANAERGTYIPLLVLASYIVASFGSYTGLTLAAQLFNAQTSRQKQALHWMGAFALGAGIWSMHFIGMLAYKMRMAVYYDPWLTGLSMLIAVIVAWVALQIIQVAKLSLTRICVSAILLGLGICAMHYTGMAAMGMQAELRYIPSLFFLSVAIAIIASGAALWIIFTLGQHSGRRQIGWRIVASLVMGAAICGMHYTGMAAAVFMPFADCHFDANQGFELLAIAVIAITIILLIVLTFTISRRLFLMLTCGAVFALPLIAIVYEATTVVNLDIQITLKEQYGLQYHGKLMNLLQRAQEVRGLTYIIRNGDNNFTGHLQSKKDETLRLIDAVDNVDYAYGKALAVSESWRNVKQSLLLPLEAQNLQPAKEEFKQYTDAIQTLTDFMDDISDNSGLSNDSRLDTNYLEDATSIVAPGIIKTIGKIRGLTTGLLAAGKAPTQWTEEDANELQSLYNELSVENDDMRKSLARARRANGSSVQFTEYYDKTIEPRLDELQGHLEHMIFKHQDDLSITQTFELATDVITLYDNLYDKTSNAFLDLLNQRLHQYTLKRDIILFSSIAAFLGFGGLFIFLYRTMAEAENAEKSAAVANLAKSDFLANMSHELRTPLNSILGMLRLMLDLKLPEEPRSLADTAFRSSVNLLEIVNDVLDLSKIEAGDMRLEYIGFDPQYILDSVVLTLEHIAKDKRIPIIRQYESGSFPYLVGDPTRLNRILTNLIGNAIKYTDSGHVHVRAFCKKLDDAHIEFRCEIADTGIGIAQEKQQMVFEKFTQADTSTTRRYGGTGLGLAITKQLVGLMGGTIGVESKVGEGSVFWFTIPFKITDKLHEEKQIRRQKALVGTLPPENARILIAEDHPMNQIFIKKLMQKFGIGHFEIVENGLEALKFFGENSWDIILMDCHMPGKNGYEATKDIRDLEKETGRHVPIVAMTANAMAGEKEKCLRYGMDEYISKPINIDELKEIFGQWLNFTHGVSADTKIANVPENNPVDLTILKTFSEGDLETEKQLIGAFIAQSEKNMAVLGEHQASDNIKLWSGSAHMFKGGALGVGAKALADLCAQAQNFSGTSQEQRALFAKIQSEYSRVKEYLRTIGLFL